MGEAPMSRRSGRTTKQLADVLEMSEGPQVILYIWPITQTIHYPVDLFAKIARQKLVWIDMDYQQTRRVFVREPTCAVIKFLSLASDPDRFSAGTTPLSSSIVFDHFCEDWDRRQYSAWMDVVARMAWEIERPY